MVEIIQKGDFSHLKNFLKKAQHPMFTAKLNRIGRLGVKALQEATPKRTGATSENWSYETVIEAGEVRVIWKNSYAPYGVNVAMLIQFGHGTRNGGWVSGINYINPALEPIFDEFADEIWEEVIHW